MADNKAFVITQIEMEENKNRIIELLNSVDRRGMDNIIKWLCDTDFFTAPASMKYHLCCKGGLAKHSLNVYERLKAKVDCGLVTLAPDTIIITALLHDVCKANFYVTQKRNKKIDGSWIEVEEWGINDEFPVGHGDKSCYIIQSCIRLSPEEYAMIRLHMGREVNSYPDYFSQSASIFPGVIAIHTADMESAYIIEARM